MTSGPSARQRFEEAKTAYETLTDYDKRLRYNIERGLPDPPRHGTQDRQPGVVEELASLIPSRWYVFAFVFVGITYVAARIYARY
jgi:DnaJ-class molecular chaperone